MADPTQLISGSRRAESAPCMRSATTWKRPTTAISSLRNKGGKRYWRLPTASKSTWVNNPFFGQNAFGRYRRCAVLSTEPGFIDDFEHVLGMSSKK